MAPGGVATTSCVADAELTVAAAPLNVTTLFAGDGSKFEPVIVTTVPIGPWFGLRAVTVIVGGTTVKVVLLVAVFVPTVTVIVPEVAPAGTMTVNRVVLAAATSAVVLLNLTVLLDGVALKLVPLIVTVVPTVPRVGLKLMMVGAGRVTMKLLLLTAVCPATLTVIFPVVAPVGTATVSCVVVAVSTVAAVPWNLTVFRVGTCEKLVPTMVTAVPTGPKIGLKLVMVGAAANVGLAMMHSMKAMT